MDDVTGFRDKICTREEEEAFLFSFNEFNVEACLPD